MTVVDANLLVALVLNDPRAPAVDRQLREGMRSGETLHAPDLLRYEAASALTRAVVAGVLPEDQVTGAWERLLRIDVVLHRLDDAARVFEVARILQRSSAYDAAYVALAQSLGSELWTLDGPLARNAAGLGLPIRLLDST